MAVWNPNKPQATDSWLSSQKSFQNNFQSIYDVFTYDHLPFDNANQGMHNQVTFQPQLTVPVEPLMDSLVLFNAISGLTGVNELFMLRPNTAAITGLTERDQNVTPGWIRLPSGIIIKWGVSVKATGTQIITFPVGAGIPVFANLFNSYVVNQGSAINFADTFSNIVTSNATTITIFISTLAGNPVIGNTNVYYLAIGN